MFCNAPRTGSRRINQNCVVDGYSKGELSMTKQRSSTILMALMFSCVLCVSSAHAEVRDPGPRPGAANEQPQPLDGLTSGQTALFNAGVGKFGEREAVTDGLGPTMNLDSCSGCHSQPTVGGSSPAKNPQFIFFNDNLKK